MFFKKTTVKLMLPAFALGAFLAACSNDDPISDSKIETVAEAESLPDCDASNEGEMVFVKKDLSLRVCVNKKWAEVTQNSDGSYDYKCETKALKDSSGIKIICGGDSIGVLKNLVGKEGGKGDQGVKGDSGVAGPQGDPGEAGKSCTAEVLADFSGMKMICGGDSVGVIRNGNDGDNGANGAGCSLKQLDETQLQIKCGNDSTTFFVHSEAPSSSASESSSSSVALLKKATVTGTAVLGPFENGSVVTLKEMRIQGDSLSYTGREFTGEVSGLKGNYVIPDVTLDYPYAEVSVTGKWRNEVAGKTSSENMTLYALADFSEGQTNVNVNILTHSEYARAKKIIKDKKYTVKAAKKIALNGMVSAFSFSTDVGVAEDLEMFVPSTSDDNKANATLLAMTLLFVRDNDTDAKIKASIDNFIKDVAEDGLWDDTDKEKDKMALWASNADIEQISLNMAIGGVYDVPNFKTMLSAFVGTHYGLGTCNQDYDGVVKTPSINDNGLHFICKSGALLDDILWNQAKDIEWETYGWGVPGTNDPLGRKVESGNVYVYDATLLYPAWRLAENDFEFDTYDFGNPYLSHERVIRKGHKTGSCYVYKEVRDEHGDVVLDEDGNSVLAWTQTPDEDADTYILHLNTSTEIKEGDCTGKSYVSNYENEYSYTWRPATALEIYLDKACNNNDLKYAASVAYSTTQDSVFKCAEDGWKYLRIDTHNFGTYEDKRDGNVYRTIKIGNQTWFAENIKLNNCVNDNKPFGCSDYDKKQIQKYGMEYTWAEADAICPTGWHLPTKSEFETLFSTVKGDAEEFDILKIMSPNTTGGVILGDELSIATNESGFSYVYVAQGPSQLWIKDEDADDKTKAYVLNFGPDRPNGTYMYSFQETEKTATWPRVRCIQDAPAANP